jgi:preprotein translocase subunit SecA
MNIHLNPKKSNINLLAASLALGISPTYIQNPPPIETTDAELAELTKWWCQMSGEDRKAVKGAEGVDTVVNQTPKVGRNDPCPCGSGKKFKKCCGM